MPPAMLFDKIITITVSPTFILNSCSLRVDFQTIDLNFSPKHFPSEHDASVGGRQLADLPDLKCHRGIIIRPRHLCVGVLPTLIPD